MRNIERAVRVAADAAVEYRRLTNSEAKQLLEQWKFINEPVEWGVTRARNDRPIEVRAKVPVWNQSRERLYLDARINVDRPWQSHWVLTWGDKHHHERSATIRRLDMRDDHANPDGQVWGRETHKHLWTVEDNNSWAYTPDAIPHDPAVPPVTPDDYRAIFEAFANEVRIFLGEEYVWNDPPLADFGVPGGTTMWEVP
ncbi:DUF6978 family protein [Pedococcus sp. 5OH_020]|uniref:DUF6978 family protein n=1 Tax=Pedococcus sp. 5OH_020 TaxID=2989814 RepID=UPI0022EA056A|nr:hypothetical protein [Pedococcus sp. 5OH_020]